MGFREGTGLAASSLLGTVGNGPGQRDLAAMFDGDDGPEVASTWCGGADESGYFGIAAPGAEAQGRVYGLGWGWVVETEGFGDGGE